MTEAETTRYLGVTPARLRELVAQGELRSALAEGPNGPELMFFHREVLMLKERLRREVSAADTEEWPDMIDG